MHRDQKPDEVHGVRCVAEGGQGHHDSADGECDAKRLAQGMLLSGGDEGFAHDEARRPKCGDGACDK